VGNYYTTVARNELRNSESQEQAVTPLLVRVYRYAAAILGLIAGYWAGDVAHMLLMIGGYESFFPSWLSAVYFKIFGSMLLAVLFCRILDGIASRIFRGLISKSLPCPPPLTYGEQCRELKMLFGIPPA
jgi:hypothetical protein